MHARHFVWIPALLLLLGLAGDVLAAPPDSSFAVWYLGSKGRVSQALELVPDVTFVERPDEAQVLVVNDAALDEQEAQLIGRAIREGKGLLLILGPQLTPTALCTILGAEIDLGKRDDAQTLQAVPGLADPLLTQVAWKSAPQVRARSLFRGIAIEALVTTHETGEVALGRTTVGRGTVYLMTAWLSGGHNPQFKEWAYFNYLIYHLSARAAGFPPQSFADYPASPVPHRTARLAILLAVVLMLSGTICAFLVLRRHIARRPEAVGHLVVRVEERASSSDWEDIGFHRPLAGFLFLFLMGLVLFAPVMTYQGFLLPRYLLPWPQAMGAWDWVVGFFQLFWLVFDVGTSQALIKYFSEHRVREPGRGLEFIQFYIWWQAITGTVQLGGVALAAAFLVPRTAVAHLSFYFIVHSLIQFPGFQRLFTYVFRAFQRFDYEQIVNLVYTVPMLFQAALVLLLRRWGAAHPVFGEAMGGVLGMGLGLYLCDYASLALGIWLYKRLGYSLKALFLPAFGWETAKEALLFGGKLTIGKVAAPLGQTVRMAILAALMLNYTEVQGNWSLAWALTVGYKALRGGLYEGLMPALSEAYNHGKRMLSTYYVSQGFKFGVWFSAFIFASLGAVADRFILGALGRDWVRAAQLAVPIFLLAALQWPLWFADRLQQAAGRPELGALMTLGEQALFIALMLLLVPPLQMWGLFLANLISVSAIGVVSWLINARWILRPRFYLWQGLAAPLLAGAVVYGLVRVGSGLLWRGDMATSLLIFLLAPWPSLPLYSFLTGLLGGWDDNGVRELERAVEMSSFARPLARIIHAGVALGSRLSPLHGRFPVSLYGRAMAEARALTAEKVPLS